MRVYQSGPAGLPNAIHLQESWKVMALGTILVRKTYLYNNVGVPSVYQRFSKQLWVVLRLHRCSQ
jgi:hypothetical protein